MWNQRPSYRFEIDNFSEKKALISSKTFVSGGCEWYLQINPKGDRISDGHLPLYLYVANSTTLRTGWKRSANYYFVLLNQSDKELHRSPISLSTNLFCAKTPAWGFAKTIPVSKFQEKGFLEKDRLIIEVHIKVIEAFDGEGGDVSNNNKKKTIDINGFQVFASQVIKVGKIFTEHPDIALDFKPTKQEVKTAYMNVLLRVIKTLNKPPKSLSETRLNKASSELSELMDVGFKLDWLKSKLEEVSLERKKPDVDGYQVQQLEERVKHLQLKLDEVSLGKKLSDDDNESRSQEVEERLKHIELKLDEVSFVSKLSDDDNESRAQQVEERVKDLKLKLDEVSFGRKLSDDDNESRAQQVEERVKNLELKLDEVSLGRKKADDTNESRAQQVEDRVEDLELKLDEVSFGRKLSDDDNESRAQQVEERVKNLELKLDEVSLGRKKADDTNEFRAKQVEKRVKNLELMELELNMCWKPKLDELEGKKTDDAIIFEQIEDRVMGIEFKLDSLNTKLEEISKEKKKADDADGSLVQQLEESVKNIELMVSHLKVEIDKKKNISSDDGFLLVD
ncbi:MATH domain and coiled-coil domain-containing protein At2g42480-like [Brassica napus]|uniref:MATH domain and coiled-coil domain-containing protein At2g42480-like n=1 Tax=Brassica napus TaxID=3708 RepID=UPI0020788C7A|nr:MATH domain and coiled-coil domain-containing protein At2g42480-like [Brassica napus]